MKDCWMLPYGFQRRDDQQFAGRGFLLRVRSVFSGRPGASGVAGTGPTVSIRLHPRRQSRSATARGDSPDSTRSFLTVCWGATLQFSYPRLHLSSNSTDKKFPGLVFRLERGIVPVVCGGRKALGFLPQPYPFTARHPDVLQRPNDAPGRGYRRRPGRAASGHPRRRLPSSVPIAEE